MALKCVSAQRYFSLSLSLKHTHRYKITAALCYPSERNSLFRTSIKTKYGSPTEVKSFGELGICHSACSCLVKDDTPHSAALWRDSEVCFLHHLITICISHRSSAFEPLTCHGSCSLCPCEPVIMQTIAPTTRPVKWLDFRRQLAPNDWWRRFTLTNESVQYTPDSAQPISGPDVSQ